MDIRDTKDKLGGGVQDPRPKGQGTGKAEVKEGQVGVGCREGSSVVERLEHGGGERGNQLKASPSGDGIGAGGGANEGEGLGGEEGEGVGSGRGQGEVEKVGEPSLSEPSHTLVELSRGG